MPSTPRGRVATRVVLGAVLLTALIVSTVFLLGTQGAHAEESDGPDESAAPAPDAGVLVGLEGVAATAVDRAGSATAVLADAATPPPPPPPPPVFCPAPFSQFVDSWGFGRSGGRRHKGVDMMAAYGTPVIAPVDGVVRSSHSSLGGIGFYLDDAAGNEYFGSHLASLDVTGPVVAGQQIGTVGSTGNAGTPHLHFEVKAAGRGSVNPYPFALNWCTTDFSRPDATALLP